MIMIFLKKFALIIYVSLGIVASGWCTEPIHIATDFKYSPIGKQVEILLDSSHQLSFTDLQSDKYENSFEPHKSEIFKYGLNSDVLWLRFKLRHKNPGTLILAVDNHFPYVNLYLPEKNHSTISYKKIMLGYLQINPATDLHYRYPTFKLPQDLPKNHYIFIKIQPFSSFNHAALNFKLFIENQDNYIKRTWSEIFFFSLIFGVLCSIILYNLFLSFILKDNIYYVYITYICFTLIYILFRSGFNVIICFPQLTIFTVPAAAVALALGFMFSRSFLNSKEHCLVLDKLLQGIIGCCLLVLLSVSLGFPKFGNILMHALGFGSFLMIAAGIQRLYQGYLPARYYLIAWTIPAFATVILGMVGFGIVPKNFITTNALAIAITLEAILLSMALGDRISLLRKEKNALQKRERRLKKISITDELTGLYNKRLFSNKFFAEIESCKQASQALSLMILDVDHFKGFNDTYGHATGDKILKQLGKIIMKNIRDHDIACRYGGDEFSIILPLANIEEALQVAERLRKNFEDHIFQTDSGRKISATISIGIAQLSNNEDKDSLFQKTDKALYQAKNNGRNQVVASE